MKITMAVPQKLKAELPYDTAIPLIGIYPTEWKSAYKRHTSTPILQNHYS
jgi:hypothetical protein